MHAISAVTTSLAAALILGGCSAPATSPAASAMPHGAAPVAYNCPELDPAQPNCRVPKYADVGALIAGERLVQP